MTVVRSMPRVLAVLLLAGLVVALPWVGGCGGPTKLSVSRLAIATGAKGGTYYPVGEALSKFLADKFPEVQIQVIETDGSLQNLRLLEEGKADIALAQNDIAHYALFGEQMFQGQPSQNVVGIAALFPEVVQIVSRADDKLLSATDLVGRKVAVGSKDSGTYTNAQQILSLAGVWDKLTPVEIPAADASRALEQKKVDAFVYTAGLPTTNIKILAQQMPVGMVGLAPDLIQRLVSKHPFYFPSEIPANTYAGQGEAIAAVEINALLVARKGLSDDDIYLLSKALFANARDVRVLHPRLSGFSTVTLKRQLSIPFAPGSQKAFLEVGQK